MGMFKILISHFISELMCPEKYFEHHHKLFLPIEYFVVQPVTRTHEDSEGAQMSSTHVCEVQMPLPCDTQEF